MNNLDLRGRSAIVTGGAKGIGHAVAERMLRSGARVVLWDADEPRLERATEALAALGPVHCVVTDVVDKAAVAGAMAKTLAICPAIDAMVCNAGIADIIKNAWDYTLAEWSRLLSIDLTSVFLSCRAAVPHMRERGYGRIVIVSTIAGLEGAPGNAAYSAAKAGAIFDLCGGRAMY